MRWLALVSGLLLATAGQAARADEPQPADSRACEVLARTTPETLAWWTVYYGERGRFVSGSAIREWTREVRCFTSEEDCEAWLAWARTIWPDRGFARPCRRGLPPWLSGPET